MLLIAATFHKLHIGFQLRCLNRAALSDTRTAYNLDKSKVFS